MNFQLANFVTTEVITMSSKDVAELLDVRHDSVKRSIERCIESGAITFTPLVEASFTGSDGRLQRTTLYKLDKRSSLVVVAQLSPSFTARVVDRWQELEAQVTPAFMLPQTFAQALALAAQQALELEQKEQQLELAKPKVEYVDKYVETGSLKTVTSVAKEMKLTANALWEWLRSEGYAFKDKKKNIWTKGFIDNGYGEMKQFTRKDNGFSGTQPYITPSGDLFIKQNFSK